MATHALHIGINDYRGTDHDLAGCVPDARNWARLVNKELRRRGTRRDRIDQCRFFGRCDSQEILVDARATRARVMKALQTLLERLGDDDWGIITFSGHGTYVRDTDGDELDGYDEALVCYGLDVVLDDVLAGELEARPARLSRVLLVTDSCHSGTAFRTMAPRLLGPTDDETCWRFLPPARLPEAVRGERRAAMRLSDAAQRPARKMFQTIHLAACLDREFAADAQFAAGPEGAFSHYALSALCSLAEGATFGDWCTAISKRLPNRDYDQRPQVNAYARALDWKIPVCP